jgi:streptogramin lyase
MRHVLLVSLLACLSLRATPLSAEATALSGRVSSVEEGAMEGVLVSAKRAGTTLTTTVVSDHDGHFSFPVGRLEPGAYALKARAVGYELDGPATVIVAKQPTPSIDLKLRKTEDLAAQLTNAEWLASFPGASEQKQPLLECMSCHTLERIARSTHNADEWVQVLHRMAGYANNTTLLHPQRRVAERNLAPERARKTAEYLASINLSASPAWSYPLKVHARPSGRATRVIITEYDMPRDTIAPHDVHVDATGMLWYSNFDEQYLGRLDTHTGQTSEFPIPPLKSGFPTGSLDMEVDRDGNIWLALMYQAGLAKFDRKTETFQLWAIPSGLNNDAMQQSMVMPRQSHVDGKVWTNDVNRHAIMRLDLSSGQFETIDPFKNLATGRPHAPYGMMADPENNLYFLDFGDENIGRVDAKTLRVRIYPTPTSYSRPRRGMLDASGHLWFAEFAANKVGMFDTGAETFREWSLPTPWTAPYDVSIDKNGELWVGSMSSDRVVRLDPASGQATEYLLPQQTNIRRVFVDNTTTPVTFWVGNNHHASIVKLEPME